LLFGPVEFAQPRALDHRMAQLPLHSQREHLPLGLLPLAPSQAKSGATTIFVNELDAGSFKCPSNDL
jgi:hypothetical protein